MHPWQAQKTFLYIFKISPNPNLYPYLLSLYSKGLNMNVNKSLKSPMCFMEGRKSGFGMTYSKLVNKDMPTVYGKCCFPCCQGKGRAMTLIYWSPHTYTLPQLLHFPTPTFTCSWAFVMPSVFCRQGGGGSEGQRAHYRDGRRAALVMF